MATPTQSIGRPSPLEGIGSALKTCYTPRTPSLPDEWQALLDRMG